MLLRASVKLLRVAKIADCGSLNMRENRPKEIRRWNVKPAYFDLTVKNLAEAKQFFERAFGWRFEKYPMPYEYYRIQAGAEDEPGIDGGIGAIADAPTAEGKPLTQVTISVPSLDACIARIVAAGGTVVEPRMAIAGVGWFAACAEPGGLLFGIMEADPRAE